MGSKSLSKQYLQYFSTLEFFDPITNQKLVYEIKEQQNKKKYRFAISSNSIYFLYACKTSKINLVVRLSDHSKVHKYEDNFLGKDNKKLYIQVSMFYWNFNDLKQNEKKIKDLLVKKIAMQLINLRTLMNYQFKSIKKSYETYQKNISELLEFFKKSQAITLNASDKGVN